MASQRSKDAAVAKSKPPGSASLAAASTTSAPSASSATTTTTTNSATATPAASSAVASSATATVAATTAMTTASTTTAKTSRANERTKVTTTSTTAPTGSASSTSTTATSNSSNATATSATTTTSASSTSASVTTATSTTTATSAAPAVVTTATTSDANPPAKQHSSASAASSAASSPTESAPPQVDLSHCALCGGEGSNAPDDMMACLCCGCGFHARCANLPQTPEEGDTFCRWECFTAYRKRQGTASKAPLSDFSKLGARVQSILVHNGPLGHKPPTSTTRDMGNQPQQPARRSKRGSQGPPNGRSRSPSPYESGERVPAGPSHNGYGMDRRLPDEMAPGPRRPSPRGRSPVQPRRFSPHADLTAEDVEPLLPRSPRSRPAARGAGRRPPLDDLPFDEAEELRSKRQKYLAQDDPMGSGMRGGHAAPRRDSYPQPPSRRQHSPPGNGAGGYPNDMHPHYTGGGGSGGAAALNGVKGEDPRQGFHAGPYDHRGLPPGVSSRAAMMPTQGPSSARMPPVDDELGSRPSSGRSARPGSGSTRYSDRMDEYDGRGPPPGPPRSRPSSADRVVEGSGGRRGRAPADSPPTNRHVQPAMAPGRFNIPWLNPAAFPAGLQERFNCRRDDPNGVFRIDLTPVFADKTMHLYQSEIDFFFRCFESADVSLVVKGMASELNQYIWAWPFILESCGSETHFSFDHFQFRHNAGELPELEYVGELRLSMAAYNAYLERYLSGSMANDVVVLEDHATKKPITLVAGENIIALNDLVIVEHCAQLYNDLIKSFQWDVFAGGIHCLLQYLPQVNRHKRFASPLLHFNFPGARGRLRDPGNGTTDTAYQVLTGSLELVIFERLEPKDRETFLRVLRAAGYDASRKTMLLDSHLRILRDSGFAWSTVLLNGGEFVHVNKGRLHFWRVVEPEGARGAVVNAPCVFLSWEWVYQGVSQRGISTECWFAMKNASLCTGGWALDPRRAIVEAAKCGVAIVRTGQFLNSLSGPGAPPILMQLAFTGASSGSIDREVVSQRQEQMVLFLESILPCMDAIVEEEFELGLVKDDSDDFRKIFDDEIMWKVVDTALSSRATLRDADYECGICGLELTNIYKQCLGCTVHARRRRPNASYPVFRICLRCHAQPERHHFKPRTLHGYYDKLCSSEGHTGLLPATRRYQAERSYFKCRCAPYVRCGDCGGCESCCCLCHTLFQTRFRYTAPEHLDHLRTDVVDVIKWHKQQQLQQQAPPSHLQRPHPHAQR